MNKQEFFKQSGEEMMVSIKKMIWSAAKYDRARGRSGAAWIRTADDVSEAIGAVWEALSTAEDRPGVPWEIVASEAARNGCRACLRERLRGSLNSISADAATETDSDRAENSLIDLYSAPGQIADGRPERRLETQETIAAACRDEIDRKICYSLASGFTSAEIAAIIGITPPAVCKRLKAIRARYAG